PPAGSAASCSGSGARGGAPQASLRPLPARPAGEAVRRLRSGELLHLPDEPAGVDGERGGSSLAAELVHLPDKPAGVGHSSLVRRLTKKPAAGNSIVDTALCPC